MPVSWNKDVDSALRQTADENTSLSPLQCSSDVRGMRPRGQIANRSQIALSLAPGSLQVGILVLSGFGPSSFGLFPLQRVDAEPPSVIFFLLDGSVALRRSRLHAIERCAGGAELRICVQGCSEFAGGVFGPFFAAED